MKCYKCEKEILGDFYIEDVQNHYERDGDYAYHVECIENKEEAVYMKNQISYQLLYKGFNCNCCNNMITTSFYHKFNLLIDICKLCFDNKKVLVAKFIDRTNMTIEEKPLNWQCIICSKLLGGGCKWYYSEESKNDICYDCYNPDTIYKFIKDEFRFFDEDKYDQYLALDRTEFSFVLNTEPDPESLIDINELLKEYMEVSGLSELNHDKIENILEDLVNANIESSIKDWVIFTKYEDSLLNFGSQLIINNNKDSVEFSQIGILIHDNHERIELNVLYKTVDEFIAEYKEFAKNIKSDEECKKGIKLAEDKLYKEYSVNTDDILPFMNSFANYIVIKNRINYYFG
ncbi:MAG: hypothetical protein ACRCZI_03875 [Cetobacterium sp.]